MRRFALALLTAMAFAQQKSPPPAQGGPAGQIANDVIENAKRAVVMVNAAIDGDARPGAGIVFGLANDRVYIATANHLVRRGASNAIDIQVEFRWSPGKRFQAELLTYYDASLDLAVLAVPGLAKTGAAGAHLSLDRIGSSASLAQGVRGDPVWAIGHPGGEAYGVSGGQVSQLEALVLKYRVAGLVSGGYSGGPVVDQSGLIVGMIRQEEPPDAEATRIDLVLSQLKVWGYPIDLQSPSAATGANAFRDVLLRYVEAAPLGFLALGARNSINGWEPAMKPPNATRCKGHGISEGAYLECVLATEKGEADAEETLEEAINAVKTALPGWTGDWNNAAWWFAFNGPTHPQSTVGVGVRYSRVGGDYEITISVFRLDGK
jgi:Trypsin-like peptidase domain